MDRERIQCQYEAIFCLAIITVESEEEKYKILVEKGAIDTFCKVLREKNHPLILQKSIICLGNLTLESP